MSEVKFIFEEDTNTFYAAVPLVFKEINFVYYGEDHCYLQFNGILIPGSEEAAKKITFVASRMFSHLFRCIDASGEDFEGYTQVSIRPLYGTNLLETIKKTGYPVSMEA